MRHQFLGFFGVILLCLTLAAGVVSAQGRIVAVREISDEEAQRQIAEGVEVIDEYEEFQRIMEEQRNGEEIKRAILADVGVTEEEFQQFAVNMSEVMQPHVKRIEEYTDSIDITPDNYIELIDVVFDDFLVPVVNGFRTTSLDFFTEEQYAKLMTRLCLIHELGQLNLFGEQFDELTGGLINDLWIFTDAVGLTEDQSRSRLQVQKDFVTELLGMQFTLAQENESLEKLLSEAKTDEERTDIQERLEKFHEKISNAQTELVQPLLEKMRGKLDTLLTAEQKAKLEKIKADIPEYMRSALAGMKTGGIHDNAEEASGPWRPGANSWVPGMGAPTNLKNDNREAPRVREPRGERRFPGSE